MKKILLSLILVASFISELSAQVKIGDNPNSINVSSLLEMESTTKGLLVPRMTTTQRNEIVSPVDGLLIFNTTDSQFNFYKAGWSALANAWSGGYSSVSASTTITTTSTSDVVATGVTLTPGAGTYSVKFNGQYTISAGNPTEQGATDLLAAYTQLMATTNTNTSHAAAFGSGETLTPGVYFVAGACSAAGNLTLDAGGDSNAVFILKFGAAFSTAAGTTIILANGASACNIFWVSEGAISLGATTTMKGTLLANNGASSLGAGCTLQGRMFSTAGAVAIDGSTISIPASCSYLNLGTLSTFAMFTSVGNVTNAGVSNITGDIGTNSGTITGFGTATVSGTFYIPNVANNALATFSIYQNGILIANSSRTRNLNVNTVDVSLDALAIVSAGQAIDLRWKIDAGTITMANRILTLVKVQ